MGDPDYGFWKRGGDRFCSNTPPDGWPYWGECPKYRPGACTEVIDPETIETIDPGCACGEDGTDPVEWPDDLLDDLVYGINFFADWAKEILAKDADSLGKEFKTWYPEAAQWIEPGADNVPPPTNASHCTDTACCYVCDAEDGELYKWYKAILEMKTRLEAWRNTPFAGTQCREVWCVPPEEVPPYNSCTASFPTLPPPGEEATFNSNGNGIPGDIEHILSFSNL